MLPTAVLPQSRLNSVNPLNLPIVGEVYFLSKCRTQMCT